MYAPVDDASRDLLIYFYFYPNEQRRGGQPDVFLFYIFPVQQTTSGTGHRATVYFSGFFELATYTKTT